MTKFGRLLLLLVVFPIYSNAFEFPYKTYSCFNGDFASIDSLLQSVKKQYTRNNRDVSTIDAEQITARYNKWKNMDQQEIDCKYFEYIVDSIPVTGFYVMPKGENIGDLVPVIFNRGGNADSVIRTPYFYEKLGPFSKNGFFVLGSFYRGAMINGIPSEYRLRDQFGGDDVNDVIGLLPVLDSIPEMKGKKVAMWGVSRGGFMSFLAAKKTNRISTIISDSTPVDLVAEQKLTNRMGRVFETWIPGYSENKQEALKARSVRYWFSDLNQIPILILHGTKDRRVSPEIVLQFAQQLQKSDYPYQINFLKDGKHALRGYEEEVSSIINNWINNTSN